MLGHLGFAFDLVIVDPQVHRTSGPALKNHKVVAGKFQFRNKIAAHPGIGNAAGQRRDLAGLISMKWCVEQANSHSRQAVHFSRLTSMNLSIAAPFRFSVFSRDMRTLWFRF